MIIGSKYAQYVEQNAVNSVRVCRDMDINQWKLHFRIADYTILDMFEQSVNEALMLIGKAVHGELGRDEVNKVIKDRLGRVVKDRKRYWRIICDEGRAFLYYVDPLQLLVNGGVDLSKLKENHAAGLAILPVIIIPPKLP